MLANIDRYFNHPPSGHEQELPSSSLSSLQASAIDTAGDPGKQLVEEKGTGTHCSFTLMRRGRGCDRSPERSR